MSDLRGSIDRAYAFVNGGLDAFEGTIKRALGGRGARAASPAAPRGERRPAQAAATQAAATVAIAPHAWSVSEVIDATTGQAVHVVSDGKGQCAECTTRELADKIRALLEIALP